MIYDTFMFFNEREIVWLRFKELYNKVDKFVIVEGDTTFSGLPRDKQFNLYDRKIIYKYIEIPKEINSAWGREAYLRNSLKDIVDYQDDDLIIHSDCDEIPRASVIDPEEQIASLELRTYYFYLNAYILQDLIIDKVKMGSWRVLKKYDWQAIRNNNTEQFKFIPNAGWHFSYMGGAEQVKNKIQSFSHQEFNIPQIIDNIPGRLKKGLSVLNEKPLMICSIDHTYPAYVLDNIDFYKAIGWIMEVDK